MQEWGKNIVLMLSLIIAFVSIVIATVSLNKVNEVMNNYQVPVRRK